VVISWFKYANDFSFFNCIMYVYIPKFFICVMCVMATLWQRLQNLSCLSWKGKFPFHEVFDAFGIIYPQY
jgi:tRNA(Arg) A34 adenosine deaminase TadA